MKPVRRCRRCRQWHSGLGGRHACCMSACLYVCASIIMILRLWTLKAHQKAPASRLPPQSEARWPARSSEKALISPCIELQGSKRATGMWLLGGEGAGMCGAGTPAQTGIPPGRACLQAAKWQMAPGSNTYVHMCRGIVIAAATN